MNATKKPIVNCHTHIFTGDHVPPYIAKTFLPWPFYYLLSISFIVGVFRIWYKGPARWRFKPWYKHLQGFFYKIKIIVAARNPVTKLVMSVAGTLITLHVFFILYEWINAISPVEMAGAIVDRVRGWLEMYYLLYEIPSLLLKVLLILILILFFNSGRNLVFFILKSLWNFLQVLPGSQTKALLRRYLSIGRFSFYRSQGYIFGQLTGQYPPGTGFVVLPMDMEYMRAGRVREPYHTQMEHLALIKAKRPDVFFPFVFIDPRRIEEEPDFFTYTSNMGTVTLGDCFIKEYIEKKKFNGFKIYPALGYYVFDPYLLPLWKYAADHQIPILTHCIRGTIFYRGEKERQWDHHPVFKQAMGANTYRPLLLPEIDNQDFCNNFTHPLNYLCLLEEELLRQLVANLPESIQELFGYTDAATPLKYNLSHLKICFGHFGGDDEWNRYFELDRDNYTRELVEHENDGIDFIHNQHGEFSWAKLEQLWKYVDWYSIICSQMLQYDNVYSDISYIVHEPAILPLLKKTLHNDRLKRKVLFGTDFYVVRNHKSEKNMLAELLAGLTEEEFDQIARINPGEFLRTG